MIHLTSPDGRKIGDIQPFFYGGRYHIFYLCNASGNEGIDLEHAVSDDLIHWTHLPAAIRRSEGGHRYPDGGCIFTGSMLEENGIVHAFYTAWDPENENGREFIRHAVSRDCVRFEKCEDESIAPDGLHYSGAHWRDFRDPHVMRSPQGGWEMLFLGNLPASVPRGEWDTDGFVFGRMRSADLRHWDQLPPLADTKGDECPDYFLLDGVHYIHSCRTYRHAEQRYGPYRQGAFTEIDMPHVRAAKTLFDGERLLWFGGWLGGPMSLPRELHSGAGGALFSRPAREVEAYFSRLWREGCGPCRGREPPAGPYRFSCTMSGAGTLQLGRNVEYRFLEDGETVMFGAGGALVQKRVRFDPRLYACKAFVDGGCVELFLDDRFACSLPAVPEGAIDVECVGWSLHVPQQAEERKG